MGVVKETITFTSTGAVCRGVLRLPEHRAGPVPAVVLCAGFSGTQDTPSIRAAAEAFCVAGIAALTFDYRSFGASDGEPRQLISLQGQRDDIRAAIGFVRSHAGIDPTRVGLWGTSLGGGHVVVVAAEVPEVSAVVAQVPFNGFPKRVEGRSTGATVRLLSAMAVDRIRGRLGLAPRYIPAVGPLNTTAVMASPEAEQTIASLTSETWQNRVAPRVLFDMMRYKPGSYASRVAAPLLVCVATADRETPEASARELADLAPAGELLTYPVAHFDVYRPEVRVRLLADQCRFLTEAL